MRCSSTTRRRDGNDSVPTKPDPLISPGQSHFFVLSHLSRWGIDISAQAPPPSLISHLLPPPCWSSSIVRATLFLLCFSYDVASCFSLSSWLRMLCTVCVIFNVSVSLSCLAMCCSAAWSSAIIHPVQVILLLWSVSCICILFWFCCSLAVGCG